MKTLLLITVFLALFTFSASQYEQAIDDYLDYAISQGLTEDEAQALFLGSLKRAFRKVKDKVSGAVRKVKRRVSRAVRGVKRGFSRVARKVKFPSKLRDVFKKLAISKLVPRGIPNKLKNLLKKGPKEVFKRAKSVLKKVKFPSKYKNALKNHPISILFPGGIPKPKEVIELLKNPKKLKEALKNAPKKFINRGKELLRKTRRLPSKFKDVFKKHPITKLLHERLPNVEKLRQLLKKRRRK